MATFQAIFAPQAPPTKVTALGATSSSAELVFSKDAKIAIEATGAINVAFGQSGMAAADASGWLIQAGGVHQFDLGNAWDRIRIFNPNATTVDVYVLQLSN